MKTGDTPVNSLRPSSWLLGIYWKTTRSLAEGGRLHELLITGRIRG